MCEGGVPDWGGFCEEQAHKLSVAFKRELAEYCDENPQYSDVPISAFARVFTAAFVTHFEETPSPAKEAPAPYRQRVWKSIFRRRKDSASKEGDKEPQQTPSSQQLKARSNTLSTVPSASAGSDPVSPPVTPLVTTVVRSATMNMLQFNQSSDSNEHLLWSRCQVSLVLAHGMYQLLIHCPPKAAQPKMSLFCFLITSVRPTSLLEVPDSTSCFVVKAKGSVEYVFDARSKVAMQAWVEVVCKCAGILGCEGISDQVPVSNGDQPNTPLTALTTSYELALHSRSPDPNGGRGNGLPDSSREQTESPDEVPNRSHDHQEILPRTERVLFASFAPLSDDIRDNEAPQGRQYRSNSAGVLLSLAAQSAHRRASATAGHMSTRLSPRSLDLETIPLSQHNLSLRSLNGFIDGPPLAESPGDSRQSSRSEGSLQGTSPLHTPLIPDHVDDLTQFPWFHGLITRIDAALLVTQHGDEGTGEYLVRQSESREGDLVLSFNYHGRAKHLRLTIGTDHSCRVQHLRFRNILHMMEHFKSHPIPLETPGTNINDIQLTNHIPAGSTVPNLPVAMVADGRSATLSAHLRSFTLPDRNHTRSQSTRHGNSSNNSERANGNVYVFS